MLLGRKEIIEILNKRILSFRDGYRQNIAILGEEFTGKSTAIKYYLNNHLPASITPIYICLDQGKNTNFCKYFCGTLLYNFLQSKGIKLDQELTAILSEAEQYLPQTVSKIKQIISYPQKQKLNNDIFLGLLDLLGIFTNESKQLCLVVFDEFHILEAIGERYIFKELGKQIILQKNAMYLLCSSSLSKAKKIIANELALLFGNFETILLEPFDTLTTNNFIKQNLPSISMAPIYSEFISNICGGYPYYLDVICQELHFICKLRDKTTVSFKDILDMLTNLLSKTDGKLNICFNSRIQALASSKSDIEALEILMAIASGVNKTTNIHNYLKKNKKSITQELLRFMEAGVVSQNGSFYKLNDRFFSLWLLLVYKIRRNLFEQNSDNLQDNFQKEIQAIFDKLSQESRKQTIDRIIELFNLFKGDLVSLEKRRVRLADFKEIQFFSFDDVNMRMLIFAKDKQDTLWITFVKEGHVTEEDVVEFLHHIKDKEVKAKKKILIGLSDIDPNARLKALKEKMLIWNRNSLNELFQLHGKPVL